MIEKQGKRYIIKEIFEKIIFASRWLLVAFYLKLCWTLMVLAYIFWTSHVGTKDIIHALEAVDVVMIANLVKMVITGSYHSFVDKFHNEEKDKTSAGMLKVKLAGSLVGVSSIFLLKQFLEDNSIKMEDLMGGLAIHGAFIVGLLVLAVADYLHCKTEKHDTH